MTKQLAAGALFVLSGACNASPWIGGLDESTHEDLRTLVDYGVINAVAITYPVPWKGIYRQLQAADTGTLPKVARSAAMRLSFYARQRQDVSQVTRIYGATDPGKFTAFDNQQGEDARLSHQIQGEFGGFSGRARANLSSGGDVYADGSYLAYDFGEVTLRAGAVDQFWGPAHGSSLILSTNARPVPTVGIFRSRATQSESPWLSWLGPWYASAELGELDSHRAVPNTKLWRTRLTVKPIKGLTIGLSWAAMWGGDGQPDSLKDFWDVITFKKECINDLPTCDPELNTTKGNHLAGYDINYTFTLIDRPVSVYVQRIGEDAKNGYKITDHADLIGVSTYIGPAKVFLEKSDTNVACNGDGSDATNCYYEHGTYQSGYRYENRAMGSTFDSDAKQTTLGARWHGDAGRSAYLAVTRFELNPDGTRPSPVVKGISEEGTFVTGYYQQPFGDLLVRLGATLTDSESSMGETDSDVTGYVDVQYHW